MTRRALRVGIFVLMTLLVSACGSEGSEPLLQTQAIDATPTPLPTTAPLAVPPPSPVPTSAPVALPEVTSTPVLTPTVVATIPPTPVADPGSDPTPSADVSPASTTTPTASAEVGTEAVETPTPIATATPDVEVTEPTTSTVTPTVEAETPTAVVPASGEPPIECYDPVVKLHRGNIEGVDALSFEGGTVYCTGDVTNGISVDRSYRHGSGLVVHRNADFAFNDEGTGYIPYSGTMNFCLNGQPASSPITAETIPRLLIVIENEAQRLAVEGAVAPAAFGSSGPRC